MKDFEENAARRLAKPLNGAKVKGMAKPAAAPRGSPGCSLETEQCNAIICDERIKCKEACSDAGVPLKIELVEPIEMKRPGRDGQIFCNGEFDPGSE